MRALIIGGSGDIGKAIVKELKKRDVEVLTVGYSSGDIQVDITSTDSIKKMYENAGQIDAVVVATGRGIPLKPITEMSKEDYLQGSQGKLLGQIDVVLTGLQYLNEGGSFTLTTGILNKELIPKGSCVAMVNSAIESFVQSGALEMPKGMRLNAVSPKLVEESVDKYREFLIGFDSIPASQVALSYLKSIFGILNGKTFRAWQ